MLGDEAFGPEMAITPNNSHFRQQWNLRAIRASEAWQVLRDLAQSEGVNIGDATDITFGSADIIITVLDTGVQTSGGQPVHAAFKGNVTSGLPKGLAFYDFSQRTVDPADNTLKFIGNHNDAIRGAHGSQCSGIAVAGARLALHPSYASDSAIVGVAPNCRLISLIKGSGFGFALYWAANMGIDYNPQARWDEVVPVGAAFRLPSGTGTDIISLSLSLTIFQNVGFDCTAFGRNGRGIMIFLSAGNKNSPVKDGITNRVIVVGATQISDDGQLASETRASYSNHGKRVDLCAPAGGDQAESGVNLRMTNTAVPMDGGTFDAVTSDADWNVTIKVSPNKTQYSVHEPMPGIFAGQYVAIGQPDLDTYQVRRITAVDVANQKFSIDKKFDGAGLDLSNTAARIPYRFAVTSAPASGNSISFAAGMMGFAAGQDIYIFDAADPFNGERARIKKLISATQVELIASLAKSYAAGARLVQGNCTVAIVGPGEVGDDTTTYKVGSTDCFFVGQLVCLIDGATNPIVNVEAVDKAKSKVTLRLQRSGASDPPGFHLEIETLGGGEYTSQFNGTSAAAPLVAGAAALMLSANPDLNWVEVRHILKETAHKVDLRNGKWADEHGQSLFGILALKQDVPATTLLAAAPAGATAIAVSDPANLAREVAVGLSGGASDEFAVVLDVVGNSAILDRPLVHFHAGGAAVKIGRKAHFSPNYGRGRIDAMRAVTMAAGWNVNDRDLWSRDFIGDTGAPHTALAGIDSPDVWVRTIGPAADGSAGLPMGDNAGPHQTPKSGLDAWIYVRVRNRGTLPSLPGMELVVTYTDTSDPTVPIQFPFPDRWQMRDRSEAPYDEKTRILTPIEGELQVSPLSGEPWTAPAFPFQANPALPSIDPDAWKKPHVLPSIPAGNDHIAIIPWRAADVPSKVAGRAFLKVHITPFDGDSSVSGNQVHTNNNLTFKEIFFTGIDLLDGGGAEFGRSVEVSTSGTTVLAPFTLEVRYIPATTVRSIAITAIETMKDATTQQKVFAFDGVGWSFADGAPTWLIIHQPSFSGVASPEQALSQFKGNLIVDHTHASLSLHVAVTDNAVPVIDRTFKIDIKAVPPRNASGAAGVDDVVFRTFTDWDLLPPQSGANNYGPLPAPDQFTRYRTAAMFSGIEPGGTRLKAYAVTSGHGLVQEIAGSSTQINLVLRPQEQINTPYGAVKYFVYRGLQRGSFLDTNGAVKGDTPAVNNELLNRYWVVRKSLNDEEKLLNPSFVPLDVTRDDLGLTTPPNPPLSDDTPIAEVFDRYNRFTLISRGMWIGDFEHTGSYGFEIIVDGPGPEPTLGDVRTLDHTIDISYTGGQPQFANGAEEDVVTKLRRERILCYIDPAAFIGLIAGGKVERNTSTGMTPVDSIHDVYNDILQKFVTRDVVYVDIRNELNQSLNFYGNYGDGTALNAAQLQVQNAAGKMAAKGYHYHGWPILALRAGVDFPADTAADKLPIRLALPVGDNTDAVLYLAGAAFHNDFPGYALTYALLKVVPGPEAVTNAFDLGVHNDKTTGVVMPAAAKIVYGRRYVGSANAVFPAARPLKDDLIDTLLSPDMPPLVPPSAGGTAWDTLAELRYVGWTSHAGFDFTVRTGRALDDFGEVAFAYVQGPAELHGGTSAQAVHASMGIDKGREKGARSFYEYLKRAGLARLTSVATNAGPAVPALRVQSVHDEFSISVFDKSADNLFSIAYTAAEANAIRSAAAATNFVVGAPRYFVAMNHEMTENGDQFPYFSMNLGLVGIVAGSNTFQVQRVDTGVKVYSFDGRNYFSAAYTNAVALLPFVD